MDQEPTPQPIYPVAGIRRIEERYLRDANPPLMERAGAAAAKVALELISERGAKVLIVAGPGNNGGDAFVMARILRQAGHSVTVVLGGDASNLPADARAACQAFREAGGEIVSEPPRVERLPPALAVDGLFGIGLTRPIEGRYLEWVSWLNGLSCPVLAIDIPSGLDADTGRVLGCAVRATHTATFIALKPGLLTRDGPDLCGLITVHDLHLPQDHGIMPSGYTVAPALFAEFLRPRPHNCHKGMFGDAGVVGGAAGTVGAALLAARAALKLGAGRVFVGLLAAEALRVDPLQPELMLRSAHEVVTIASALALGPGLGQSEDARGLLQAAIARPVPLALDADALNLVALHPVLARHAASRTAPTLITPHPAEAARLLGVSTTEVQADRVAAACALAKRFHCHALVKGAGSVIAAPDGRWFINGSGNPGMASAGMGDVLSGIVVALLAQRWDALCALLAAVHVHGAAGDELALSGNGPNGLAAGELIDPARRLLNRWIRA
jgi:ADP-dependent NAD(P)H-hydrate dehydratase / NAD(P)H-hydrate epimerase